MENNITNIFRDELNPYERIVWQGQPQQGFLLRSSDAFAIPFSLLWCGFALFWEWSVVSGGAPFFFMLWGIPFVVVGIYIVIGRFFYDKQKRDGTYYALTNERVIIISGLFTQTTRSLDIKNIPEINISTNENGRGTITFGSPAPMGWFYSGSGFPTRSRYNAPPCFELIENAKIVYNHIKRLQREDN